MNGETATQATVSGEGHAAGTSQNVPQCPNGGGGDKLSDAQSSASLTDAQLHAIELLIAGTAPSKVAKGCLFGAAGTGRGAAAGTMRRVEAASRVLRECA